MYLGGIPELRVVPLGVLFHPFFAAWLRHRLARSVFGRRILQAAGSAEMKVTLSARKKLLFAPVPALTPGFPRKDESIQ